MGSQSQIPLSSLCSFALLLSVSSFLLSGHHHAAWIRIITPLSDVNYF